MLAKPLTYDKAQVGQRVQDYWGATGVIQWKGKLGKSDKPPNGDTGHYFGIEYDEESDNPLRCDGTWNGKRYFQCEERKGMMCRSHDFLPEVNQTAVELLRKQFGERIASWHDFEIVKFCIARQFDMPKVTSMLEGHLNWRDTFKPSADEYFPPTMAEDYPCGYSGKTDNDGNIIYCERPGNGGFCAPGDFVHKYTLPRIARWHACGLEMSIQRMRDTDYRSKRMCYIVDLLNVNAMSKAMIGFAQTLAKVEQDNYPENLGRVFIVNCPLMFRLAWKMVKIFIDDRTNKKISFIPPGKAVEAMKKVMKEEDIPDIAGGPCSLWKTSRNGVLGSSDASKATDFGDAPAADAPEDDEAPMTEAELRENGSQGSSSPQLKSSGVLSPSN